MLTTFRALRVTGVVITTLSSCSRDDRLADGVDDTPADFCRFPQADAPAIGLTRVSPFVDASETMVTHRQSQLTARSIQIGDPADGVHAIVVTPTLGAAGEEALRFVAADPGSGASHWIAIADDGHRDARLLSSIPSFVKVRDLLRLLAADGWVLVRTRGSHQQLQHAVKLGVVTVAGSGNDDLAPGTLHSALPLQRRDRTSNAPCRMPFGFIWRGSEKKVSLFRTPARRSPTSRWPHKLSFHPTPTSACRPQSAACECASLSRQRSRCTRQARQAEVPVHPVPLAAPTT